MPSQLWMNLRGRWLEIFGVVAVLGFFLFLLSYVFTTNVSGKIVEANTHAPVRGAQVECSGKIAVSADDGSFVLERVRIGKALVMVTRKGFAPTKVFWNVTKQFAGERIIELRPNVLSGRISTDPFRASISGAILSIGKLQTKTDQKGNFVLTQVPTGIHTLEIAGDNLKQMSKKFKIREGSNEIAVSVRKVEEEGVAGLVPGDRIDKARQLYGPENESMVYTNMLNGRQEILASWNRDTYFLTIVVDKELNFEIQSISVISAKLPSNAVDFNGVHFGIPLRSVLDKLGEPSKEDFTVPEGTAMLEIQYVCGGEGYLRAKYSVTCDYTEQVDRESMLALPIGTIGLEFNGREDSY